MKLIYAVSIFLTFFASCFSIDEQESLESVPKFIQHIDVKELKELDAQNRPQKSQIGPLSGVVNKKTSSIIDSIARSKKKKKVKSAIIHPNAEGLAYVNGYLTHVSNYPQTVIYTELEGPFYGTQTTMTYDGIVLYVNYDYDAEYTSGGVVFHHFYSDSEIITGSNQIIRFYK